MAELRPSHILVIDDDLDTRELYRMLLESVGYVVADAGHVKGGIEAARVLTPDVVLSDWLLPDGTCLDVGRRLRSERATRKVPVIAVTGLTLETALEMDARQVGIAALLQKPANPDDILGAIRTILTRANERRVCDAATRMRRYAMQAWRSRGNVAAGTCARVDPGLVLERAARRSGSSVALLIADDRGRYVAVGGAVEELTGYAPAELTGLSVWDLTPLPNTADGQGLWRQFIATGAQQGRYVLRRRDGQPVDAQYCALANIAPGWHVSAVAGLPDFPSSLR